MCQAYSAAAHLLTLASFPMAATRKVALPIFQRKEIISSHCELPLTLQHDPICLLKIMEDVSLAAQGQAGDALKAYEPVAAIGYEVR